MMTVMKTNRKKQSPYSAEARKKYIQTVDQIHLNDCQFTGLEHQIDDVERREEVRIHLIHIGVIVYSFHI
jgi:hypothetical protein